MSVDSAKLRRDQGERSDMSLFHQARKGLALPRRTPPNASSASGSIKTAEAQP